MTPINTVNALEKDTFAIVNSSVQAVHVQQEDKVTRLYPRKNPNAILRTYILTDIIAIALGFMMAWGLAQFVNNIIFDRAVLDGIRNYDFAFLKTSLIAAGVILWFSHTDHYRMRTSFWTEAQKITSALFFAMMADGFLQFAYKQDASRLWLVSSWAFAALAIIALRVIARTILRRMGLFGVRTLLVGTGETAEHLQKALRTESDYGYEIAAQVKNLPAAFLQAGASWKKLCAIYNTDHIIIALDGHDLAAAERPLAQLARESVSFSVAPPLRQMPVFGMVQQYFFSHDTILMTRNSGLEQPLHCFMKRAMDIAVSGFALMLLSPVLLMLALFVKLDGGPAFFGHRRLGRGNTEFYCLKFRSMVANGDAILKAHLLANPQALKEWQATRKLQNDPRVTALGKFLRKSSLDELPQLFNVLLGDMSLVGPRPIVNAEVENYDGDIAHYFRVRPGITGLWQVSGRNDVTYGERVHMDSWYVRNWSLWHDIAIIFKTIPALLKRRGAY